MRFLAPSQFLCVAASMALFTACSGGGTPGLTPGAVTRGGLPLASLSATSLLRIAGSLRNKYVGHDSCAKKGPVVYASDIQDSVINIYMGTFAGQFACGQITTGLLNPYGLYVDPTTHDLYVANDGGSEVLVYHKHALSPYNVYVDPTGQETEGVAIGSDGTILASNYVGTNLIERGSISTWHPGPNGGTFVGNFPMTDNQQGGLLAVDRHGKVFYFQTNDGQHGSTPTIWHVLCPAGVCGAMTQVPNVSFYGPDGIMFDDTNDLLVSDELTNLISTFELPNPVPSTFPISSFPSGMALDSLHKHFYNLDYNIGANIYSPAEYQWPSFAPIGTVQGNGVMAAIAVDP
jgi:hypothetical protein